MGSRGTFFFDRPRFLPSLPSLILIDPGQSLLFARQWDGVIESDKVTDRPTADGKRFQLKGMAKHSSPAPATSSSKWGLKLSCGFYAVQQASRLMVRSCDRVCLTRTVSNLRPKCFSNPHVDDARCCCCPLIPFGSFSEEKMWANREGTAMTAGPAHSLSLDSYFGEIAVPQISIAHIVSPCLTLSPSPARSSYFISFFISSFKRLHPLAHLVSRRG